MQFEVFFEDEHFAIEVEDEDIAGAQSFFSKMDDDMDGGWRMGPEYVHEPDTIQRGQIVAERLLLAIESENDAMSTAMAAYIAWRIPNIRELHIDTSGEPLLTEIIT